MNAMQKHLNFKTFLISLVIFSFVSISSVLADKQGKEYTYVVRKASGKPVINADWDKKFWKKTGTERLNNYMGERPEHFPPTQVRVKYDKENIYVIFLVDDKYVRAVAKTTNGRVFEDSCVEFFFTPGPDTERGYFNLETNCKGIFLFEYHKGDGKEHGFVDLADAAKIEIAHSLKENVENEITGPLTWSIEYKIPFAILSKYIKTDVPVRGTRWRANFYKCADKTSHPHWLTWAPVNYPKPRFHLPEFFGWLEFK